MGTRFLLYWIPLIVWLSGIFLVSSLPTDSFPQSKVMNTFALHLTAFFVLFLLFYRLFRLNSKKQLSGGVLLASFSLTILISFSKEYWQLFFPTRSFSLNDLLIDGGAALLGILAVSIISVCNQKRSLGHPLKGIDLIENLESSDR